MKTPFPYRIVEEGDNKILSNVLVWENNGRAICNRNDDQEEPRLCNDGFGGVIITWTDTRGGSNDIYAQRVDPSGQMMWDNNGIAIANISGAQSNPRACNDGNGGAIIVWEDDRDGYGDIYAQRVNSLGHIQWNTAGVAISTVVGFQSSPELCSDGQGGAIIVWWDSRGSSWDVYAQRVNSTGTVQWAVNGIPICNAANDQWVSSICSDGHGGAFIAWYDMRVGSYYDIYMQRVNSTGHSQWTSNGVKVCTAEKSQYNPQICSDGFDGAIVSWHDRRNGSYYDIYAQRINSAGIALWNPNGTVICKAANSQIDSQIVSDGFGGAIITWQDYRSGTNYDIYAQKINFTGDIKWESNGIAVCTKINDQTYPKLCDDKTGGAIIVWQDNRMGVPSNDIYAQLINSTGAICWDANGTAVCTANNAQGYPRICDNSAGAYIIWDDFRNANYDIYAQYIVVNAPSRPNLHSILPNPDTDGLITLSWNGSLYATEYYIFRNTTNISSVLGMQPIAKVLTLNYTDTIIENGTFYYVVMAGNAAGNSSISNCNSISIEMTLPAVPTLDLILPNPNYYGVITLNWNKVINATRYYIYRNTSKIISISGLTAIGVTFNDYYTDILTINATFYYVIVAGNPAGNSSISNCENVSISIFPIPAKPILNLIQPNPDYDGIINLDWNDINGAAKYYVYRDNSIISSINGKIPISITNTSIYMDMLTVNGTYYYVVIAGNPRANSSISICRSVIVQILQIPSVPILNPILPNPDYDGIVNITWNKVNSATKYYVYRNISKITSIAGLLPIATPSQNYYVNTLLTNGSYFYVVIAGNPRANSSISNCENVTVQILQVPVAPILNPILPNPDYDGIVNITWNKVSSATKYYVYRNISKITSIAGLLPIATPTQNYYIDILLTNGSFFYAVIAGNLRANSSISNCENVTVQILQIPSVPILNPILPNPDYDGTINLIWDKPSGAVNYYVYRNNITIISISGLNPIAVTSNNYFNDTITTNATYYYVIVSGNARGNSSISNCENISVQIIQIPNAPILNKILPNPDYDRIINITWCKTAGAINYYIYRNNSNITSISSLKPIAVICITYFIDNIPNNGTYYYVIVAGNLQGNSSISNCESVVVILTSPPTQIPGFELLFQITAVLSFIYIYYRRQRFNKFIK